MQIHDKEELFRKVFHFLSTLVLLMVCNGCFTYYAESICLRCHDDIQIIERHGELSNDQKSLSIHLKRRRDYCRDPFGIWKGSIEEEETHVYPLTSPESHTGLKQFSVILDNNAERISCQHFEVKDEKEAECKDIFESDYNRLILPVLKQVMPVFEIDGAMDDCSMRIHPDDLPFISRPFVYEYRRLTDYGMIHPIVFRYWRDSPHYYRLVIPYKQESNVRYVYLPGKSLITPSKVPNKPNTSTYILEVLFIPPAVILDVLTFPIQFIYEVYEGADC